MAMTYEEIEKRLGRLRSVQVDKRRGTEIRRAPGEAGEAGDIQIRYRGIPVVTLHPDHTYTLRTGGLATRTIRNRITEYSPVTLEFKDGGYYIEDRKTGILNPFFEGTRVDMQGVPIRATAERTTEEGASGIMGTGIEAPLDEAHFRAYVRQLVQEALKDFGVSTRPVQAAPRLRATVRATARPLQPGEDALPLHMIEQMMIQAGASPAKARRVLRETRDSLLRGRPRGPMMPGKADDDPDEYDDDPLPHVPTKARAGVGSCKDCGLNLAAHYDRSNRYRGCEYAHEHREDSALV